MVTVSSRSGRWRIGVVVATCCWCVVVLLLAGPHPLLWTNLWAVPAPAPLRATALSFWPPRGPGTRRAAVTHGAVEAVEVPADAPPPDKAAAIPLRFKTAAEAAAEAQQPPTPEQDRRQVAVLVAQQRAKLGKPAYSDDGAAELLSEAELKTLWRFVNDELLRLGAAGIKPSHLNTLADVARAQGVIKVKVADHRVNLPLVAAALVAHSREPLRFLALNRKQKVILLGTDRALERIRSGTFYPKKRAKPDAAEQP
eukprot:EG_transcript_17223